MIDEFFNGKPAAPAAAARAIGRFDRGGCNPFQAMMAGRGGGRAASTTSKVRVVADPGSNSLFVHASPLELITIRNLSRTRSTPRTTSAAAQKTHSSGRSSHANAAEVAQVIQTVYRDFTGQIRAADSSAGFPGFGSSAAHGARRRPARPAARDANGNPQPSPLSIGVDERSNML